MKPPPDLPLPVVGAVVLLVASIAHTATTPTTTTTRKAASTTPPASSTASPPSSSAWTFSQPGSSRISFTPPLTETGVQRLQFQFKTVHSNGLLVHHYLQHYDPQEHPRLNHYELFAEIRQGGLRVGHVFNTYQDTINIGRAVAALNDDRWHKVEVVLNQTRRELVVTLDNNSMTQSLKAYLWGNAKDILDWSKLRSTVTFGDTQAAKFKTVPFVGCLKELYYSLDGSILSPVPLQAAEGVTPGCVDQCQGRPQCVNNGRCVNLYTGFHCDCFGMDYEGERCEKKGPSVLTFSGYEWVTYRLYDGDDNRHFADNNRVSLEFKTERPSGILLYAVGSSPYHNHITAAIHTGVLHVSLAFGSDDLDFPIGIGLDDNRWHNLTIDHRGRTVNVYLDGDLHSKQIKNPDVFLSLDPLAYFGGGDNFVLTRGLPVTRNFVGCMKNVYFNAQSVLYKLSNNDIMSTRYHGGERPTFGCSPVQDIPISFPSAASTLRWSKGPRGENLTVELNFRTVRKDSIMFYAELLSRRDGGGGYDYGVMEVWVREGRPMLVFIPSSHDQKSAENLTLPITVNDAKWHSMQITLQLSHARLRVDTVTKSTQRYRKFIEHRGQVMLGFGLRRYKETEGYVGCMEKIIIQGLKLDPISIVETNGAGGLILDGCFLIDHCNINNICEHGSECLSDWDGVQCLCEDNGYQGKACHFPEYMTTCDDYYQAGHTESGTYMIDMDGSGSRGPTYVDCQMGAERDGMMYGAVIVEHNFAANTAVRGALLEDRQYQLTYREMDRSQTLELTRVSSMCEQFFKYQCTEAPIQLGKKTWFTAANGAVVDYLGSAKPGFCSCPDGDLCNEERCYCDAGETALTMDEGYSRTKQKLPIIQMTFLQTTRSGRANMTLGPLVCWGSETQPLERSVTMTTESSYLELPAWRHGDLRLRFKTHQDQALLILQSTSGSPHTGDMFTLKIISAHEVEFRFRVNETIFTERLSTPRALTQGDWHYVSIEFDPYDVRLGLDTVRRMYPFRLAPKSGQLHFTGMMYIGGVPNQIADNYGERTQGFTGCLRPLVVNDETVDLSHNMHADWTGISAGCKSSCWPNPCEHGGTCKEEWGDYTCLCQDPWAHQGRNCEHNLNQDAVTFSGETTSFLKFDMTQYSGMLDKTIVLSFRTLETEALLLYAHDHLSNFVQMELQQGNTVVFTYNSDNAIVRGSITAPGNLNDGKWKQVIAQEYYNLTKLIMGEQSTIIEFKRVKLNTYSMDPFQDSSQQETVFIPRTYEQPEPFVHLYVGGMGEEGTTSTPHLKGCVRGMRFGTVPINLGDGVRALGNTTDLMAACNSGCNPDPCLNNGYCYEHWQHGNFTCDCSESDYSGIHCEKEASAWLDGQSVVQHRFVLPVSAQRTITERALLHFRTSGTSAVNAEGQRMDMALFYITSSESGDYILARLDSDGNALIETNQGVGIYRMKVSGNFANGELHEMEYTRAGTNMYLTLDGVKEASIVYPDYDLDKINTILIGGLLPGQTEFENTANFTGCISNTVFTPEANLPLPLKIRSLKELHLDSSDITVFGPQVNSCSAAMLVGKPITVGPPAFPITTASPELLTMPVWNVGPAQLVTLSPPIVTTEAPTTPPKPTPVLNSTQAMVSSSKGDNVDDLTVIIVVSVIGGILVITIIVALLLFRKRRRHYEFKKEEIELKQPLNSYHAVNSVPASPVPNDHLAKLDEFSMITALLGPRTAATNGDVPHNINRHSQGSFTKPEETTEFLNPIFNKRKQRPASSISEVLEELERRQQAQNTGNTSSTEDIVGRPHGEGDLEWDPQADRTPLTYEDITFFNTPLLAPILDENEDSHVSSLALSESKSDTLEKAEDSSPSVDESHTNQNSLLDGNGDSGYEAESRPEMTTEEDVTPTADDDRMLHEEEEEDGDEETNAKLYMYNISNIDSEDSPILSAPNTRLLKRKNKDT